MTESEKRIEFEANHFAMCLLMPRSMVQDWIKEHGEIDIYDSNKLKRFADDFKVPEQVARIRINQIQQP